MNERFEEILQEQTSNHQGDQSFKASNHIVHRGHPPSSHSTFAPTIKHTPSIPENLWTSGTCIYSLYHPERCIPPASSPSDTTLRFNSRFESGNLLFAYQLNQNSYHLILEYDKNKSGSCQWFYFQITNTKKDMKYNFYISGFHKSNGVFNSGSKVFWYSTFLAQQTGVSWQRGGSNYDYLVTYSNPSDPFSKNKRSTLQFQMQFPYDMDTCYLCYAIPYTYSDLNDNIIKWHHKYPSIFQYSTLCQTQNGNNCPRITLTSPSSSYSINSFRPNSHPHNVQPYVSSSNIHNVQPRNRIYKSSSAKPSPIKPAICLTARVHPGESNGSIVLHGLIDFLLSSSPCAKYLLDHYVFEIVPMLAIDGVIEGNYRMSAGGSDLNRVWKSPDEALHPTVFHTKKLFTEIASQRKIEAYIDFHGHSRQHGSFAYGCPNEDPMLKDKEKVFPRIVSTLTDAFNYNRCVFSYPHDREGASRVVFRRELDILNSFTIESSFGGLTTGIRAGQLNDEVIWKELGAKCGEALYHLLVAAPITKEIKVQFTKPFSKKEEKKTVHALPTKSPFSQVNLLKMPQPSPKTHGRTYIAPKPQLLRFVSR